MSCHQRNENPSHVSQNALKSLERYRIQHVPPAAWYISDFISRDEEQLLLKRLSETPLPKWKTVASGRRLQYWGGNMTRNGILVPEPLPDFLYPDMVQRIDSLLRDVCQVAGPSAGAGESGSGVFGINQVLVNEYASGQGISPHEDGPAFLPMVATLSLGSHTVLDIHHYLSETSPSPPMVASTAPFGQPSGAAGRPIAAIPLAHLLLLPRSLLILSSSLYAAHLHGISGRVRDIIVASDAATTEGVQVANASLLGDAEVEACVKDGGRWEADRGVRTSLTFRRAEKVVKGGAFSVVGGRLGRR